MVRCHHSHQLIHDYSRGRKVALHSTVSRSAGFRQLVAPNSTRPHRVHYVSLATGDVRNLFQDHLLGDGRTPVDGLARCE